MAMACVSGLQKSHELDSLSICQAHLSGRRSADLPPPRPHALPHADSSPGPWLPTPQVISHSRDFPQTCPIQWIGLAQGLPTLCPKMWLKP